MWPIPTLPHTSHNLPHLVVLCEFTIFVLHPCRSLSIAGRSQSVPLRINVGDGDAKEGAKSLLDTADIQSKTGPTASALPDASGKVGDLAGRYST